MYDMVCCEEESLTMVLGVQRKSQTLHCSCWPFLRWTRQVISLTNVSFVWVYDSLKQAR